MSVFRKVCIAVVAMFAIGPAIATGIRLPDYQAITLDNGATVLLMPRNDVPLVAANVAVRGGALADAAGKEGTADLLGGMLSKGAGNRDALQFAQALDGAGGSLGFGSSREAITASAQFLSKDSALMLSLLADALLRPKMEQAEFDKLRKRAIDGIANAKDSDPRQLIGTYAGAWLFRGHPYGRATGGDETSLATITLADLQAFRQQQMGGDRLVIAIAGDFDASAMAAQVKQAFGGWGKAAGTLPQVEAKPRELGRRVLLVDKPGATQTYFALANIGSRHGDPAEAAQDLVHTAFGGRFTSMLNTELRIKSGLSYGASAQLQRPRQPGASQIGSFTKTESTKAAIDLAIATLDRLHRDGLDAATIDSAKRYVAGQFAPGLETAPQLAARLVEMQLYGDSRDAVDGYLGRIAAATPAQVADARAVFPASADLAIVAIGDAAKIRAALQGYGPLTEMKLTDPRFSP
ncbi:MAG: insulinase family protein [Thermomonas sp.]|uniref:M16 family metallopeptidase n=2 Tax=Thermomonas sp. TaxID=1971895 RepID=UPI001B5EBCA1|nr:pitrilysin family protein [Thermomonas sp.]MBP7159481.1 insulinase family protein [Thermomonas sp.]MBP7787955.1 insulinase family protein [Thermomonas sp.]MBP8615693.1 insulinase family protein [Thermomonas sp.]MBP8647541.1 insulinase family protein [Thermomonas sp.]